MLTQIYVAMSQGHTELIMQDEPALIFHKEMFQFHQPRLVIRTFHRQGALQSRRASLQWT